METEKLIKNAQIVKIKGSDEILIIRYEPFIGWKTGMIELVITYGKPNKWCKIHFQKEESKAKNDLYDEVYKMITSKQS